MLLFLKSQRSTLVTNNRNTSLLTLTYENKQKKPAPLDLSRMGWIFNSFFSPPSPDTQKKNNKNCYSLWPQTPWQPECNL